MTMVLLQSLTFIRVKIQTLLKKSITNTKDKFSKIQNEAGVGKETINTSHHTILMCPKMLKLLDPNPLQSFLEYYFNGKFILYTMGASSKMPNGEYVYTQKNSQGVLYFYLWSKTKCLTHSLSQMMLQKMLHSNMVFGRQP